MKDKRFDELDERIKKIEQKIKLMDFHESNCYIKEKQKIIVGYSQYLDVNIYKKAKSLEENIENLREENKKIKAFMHKLKETYEKNGTVSLFANVVVKGRYKQDYLSLTTPYIEALDIVYKRNEKKLKELSYHLDSLFEHGKADEDEI